MTLYIIILVIYGSFIMDFLVWPIPSESSTYSLLKKEQKQAKIYSIFLVIVFVANLVFYLTPSILTLFSIINKTQIDSFPFAISCVTISIIGRLITLKAARILRNNKDYNLIKHSLFKYSRNPISLGMHITIFGLVLFFGEWYLWIGMIFYAINIHLKIMVEERQLIKIFGEIYNNYKASTPRYILI